MPFVHRWCKALATDARLTATDIAVARTLALHMNADGTSCRPTHALIAFEAHMTERSVRNGIGHVRKSGWLEQTGRSAPGRAASYVARIPKVPAEHRNETTTEHRNETTTVGTEHRNVTTRTPERNDHLGSHEVAILAATPRARRCDPIFDAFAEAWGIAKDDAGKWAITGAQAGKVRKAAKDVRDAGATEVEVRIRCERYRQLHPSWEFTPNAVASHWSSLGVESERVNYDAPAPVYR